MAGVVPHALSYGSRAYGGQADNTCQCCHGIGTWLPVPHGSTCAAHAVKDGVTFVARSKRLVCEVIDRVITLVSRLAYALPQSLGTAVARGVALDVPDVIRGDVGPIFVLALPSQLRRAVCLQRGHEAVGHVQGWQVKGRGLRTALRTFRVHVAGRDAEILDALIRRQIDKSGHFLPERHRPALVGCTVHLLVVRRQAVDVAGRHRVNHHRLPGMSCIIAQDGVHDGGHRRRRRVIERHIRGGEFDFFFVGTLVAVLVHIPGEPTSLAAVLVRHHPVDIHEIEVGALLLAQFTTLFR